MGEGGEGLLKPRKYYIGAFFLLLVCWVCYGSLPEPFSGFWKGVFLSLLLSFGFYSLRFYILSKLPKEDFSAQLGTTVLSLLTQTAGLLLFIWMGEREGFILGFFIAHFANILILVFAR
ncbi:hypothetical protein EHO59_08365 [Leptospira semungkisensis]|uniref:Uncharacterized protein n=1 Tax=Leptospira semungkisensis TaxID=2484985 RepID=A0A4R9G222_9LEPT|nr:hypothetical protein EHO59_08365 [Leptospira semungkisensis]